jgi:hypothetical protein
VGGLDPHQGTGAQKFLFAVAFDGAALDVEGRIGGDGSGRKASGAAAGGLATVALEGLPEALFADLFAQGFGELLPEGATDVFVDVVGGEVHFYGDHFVGQAPPGSLQHGHLSIAEMLVAMLPDQSISDGFDLFPAQ